MLNEVGQCPHTQIALKCLEFHRVKWLSIVSGSTSLNKCFNFGEDLGPAEHASFCINFFTGLAIKKTGFALVIAIILILRKVQIEKK